MLLLLFFNAIGGVQPIQLKDKDKEESGHGFKYESIEHERLAFAFKRVRGSMDGWMDGCVNSLWVRHIWVRLCQVYLLW